MIVATKLALRKTTFTLALRSLVQRKLVTRSHFRLLINTLKVAFREITLRELENRNSTLLKRAFGILA